MNSKIKVIHILGTVTTGGAEIALYNILSNWKDKTFEQKIYYIREYSGLKVNYKDIGIKVNPLNWNSERDWWKIYQLYKIFKIEQPHIVHTHLWTGNYWVVIAASIAGVPVVIETIHLTFRNSRFGNILHKMLRPLIFPFADASICVSDAVKRYMKLQFHHDKQKLHVIWNGIPHIAKNGFKISLESLPQLGKNFKKLLFVSRLVPTHKGLEIVIESLSLLKEKGISKFVLLVAGSEMDDAPGFLKTLKDTVERKKLNDFIAFLGNRTDIPQLMELSDIFIMPSLYEGGPITVLEAMRAGKPVIATRTGAVPEYVIDGVTGIILPPGDSKALADAIEYMITHPELWKQMGENGKKRFLENFTIDVTVDQIEELYKKLLVQKGIIKN